MHIWFLWLLAQTLITKQVEISLCNCVKCAGMTSKVVNIHHSTFWKSQDWWGAKIASFVKFNRDKDFMWVKLRHVPAFLQWPRTNPHPGKNSFSLFPTRYAKNRFSSLSALKKASLTFAGSCQLRCIIKPGEGKKCIFIRL